MKLFIISFASGIVLCSLTIFFIQYRSHLTAPERMAAAMSQSPSKKKLWHCGMHPQVIEDHPGRLPDLSHGTYAAEH